MERIRSTSFVGVSFAILLASCDAGGSAGVQNSQSPEPDLRASDNTLSCQQISAGITHENLVIKRETAIAATSGGATEITSGSGQNGTDSPVFQTQNSSGLDVAPGSAETPAQVVADRDGAAAVKRADTLVALGKVKKCFL